MNWGILIVTAQSLPRIGECEFEDQSLDHVVCHAFVYAFSALEHPLRRSRFH
jgi:hypothetical protein